MSSGLPQDLKLRVGAPREPLAHSRMCVCAVCGQMFDLSKLNEAFHHDDRPHAPLPSL